MVGDFNAHSMHWDPFQPEDSRGESLAEWMAEQNLTSVNNGDHTRVNPATGGLSTPDVSFVPSNWCSRVEWTTGEDLGSDHLPVFLLAELDTSVTKPVRPQLNWNWQKADWVSYAEMLDEKITAYDGVRSFRQMYSFVVEMAMEVAKACIPKACARKSSAAWMTPVLARAIKDRNRLRKEGRDKRAEWVEKCVEVRELTMAAKEKRWVDFL